MKNSEEIISEVKKVISDFFNTFEQRPAMLGTPKEVNSIFFYLDRLDIVSRGFSVDNYHEISWISFLIKKKMIVGSVDILREKLEADDENFELLQDLRREFIEWRHTKMQDL